jgi:hypothetical protein
MSKDPAARKRSMANLKNGTGAQKGQQVALRNGSRAKLPVGDLAQAREEIQEALAAAAPLRDREGGLPIADRAAVEIVACGLSRYRYMQEYLENLTPFTSGGRLRYTLVRELRRTEKQLLAALAELGMTPKGRASLGLDLARTQEIAHVKPNREPEHLLALARALQRAGMVPTLPEDAEVVEAEEVPIPIKRRRSNSEQ